MRKLPVYIVVDTSESMYGEPIEQVNRSLDNMLASLYRNPYALETVWLSLISFDSTARVLVPLTELSQFRIPTLKSRPGTGLGNALDLLRSQIAKEVTLTTAEQKGDWRPIVFLLTDGQPTDNWRRALDRLRAQRPKPANIYAIGCGAAIDYSALKEIADVTFQVPEATPETLSKLFVWMSSAIQSVSRNASQEGLGDDELRTPDGVEIVGDDYPNAPDFPPQLFFHCVCGTTRKPCLMRLAYDKRSGLYEPEAAFKVPDDFFTDGGFTPPSISSEYLAGMPTCPHCGGEYWAVCSNCGAIFCHDPRNTRAVTCPECREMLELGSGRNFSVQPSAG